MLSAQERKKYANELCRLANDRARLEHGFRMTLSKLGVIPVQVDSIVKNVRAGDFDQLRKTMKIPEVSNG